MKLKALLPLLLLAVGFTFTSCYKQKATVAVIKVVDINNTSISNARVIIYGTGTQGVSEVRDTLFTNTEGEAIFNLDNIYQPGQAGVAVLDILVAKDGASSQGIIKVEQEEITSEKVIL